jgi:hypothetical protein
MDIRDRGLVRAETGRHNVATEGLTAAGHGVTMRGQDRQSADNAASRGLQRRGQDLVNARATEATAAGGRAPAGYRWTADGNLEPIPGGPAAGQNKPLTEVQGNATAFGMRMKDASQTIRELEESRAVDPSGLNVAMAGGQGLLATPLNAAAGAMNPKAQVYKQAQKNWITANLRKESGAAIPVPEMEAEIVKWFPVMGDRPEVIASKAAAREVAERAMSVQAGPGAKNIIDDGARGKPPAPRRGQVVDGYLFNGGDPADKANWRKVH